MTGSVTRSTRITAIVMFVSMVLGSLLAMVGQPIYKLADQRSRMNLEGIIPTEFGDWRLLPPTYIVLPNPQTAQKLAALYTQLLTRTYVDRSGRVIMLSIAYGEDQRATMAVHYPEVCYPAQGFQLRSNRVDEIATVMGRIPVRRLETFYGQARYEPVTYWTTIGDEVSLGGFGKRLAELKYGLKRQIPDGLLFRISSINRDTASAFRDQDLFVQDLMKAVGPSARRWLAGRAMAGS